MKSSRRMRKSRNFATQRLAWLIALAMLSGCGVARMSGSGDGNAAAVVDQPRPCRILPGDSGQTIVIGQLVRGDETAAPGAVLIENGVISAVGDADEIGSNSGGATVIDCADWYVSPGFVNAHEHLAASGGFPDPLLEPVYAHREQWQGRAGPGAIMSSSGAGGMTRQGDSGSSCGICSGGRLPWAVAMRWRDC